jgi:hypothetical protein
MPSYCSPNNEQIYDQSRTCYNKKQLQIIARKYNEAVSKNQTIPVYQQKDFLLRDLKNRLRVHESKWMDMDFMKYVKRELRQELRNSFRPSIPAKWLENSREWLNTIDITDVMTQYERKYRTFKFLGVHPIDFAYKPHGNTMCISDEICKFDVHTVIKAGYTQFAIIFNLDKHYEPGSHWVSLYISLSPRLKNYGCYFIDSNAAGIPNEIHKFVDDVELQMRGMHPKKVFQKINNTTRFQYKNTECGMFSIFFITQFLKNISFDDIVKTKMNDDDVHKYRYIFYNTYNVRQ